MKLYKVTAVMEYSLLEEDEESAKKAMAGMIKLLAEQDNIETVFEITIEEKQ